MNSKHFLNHKRRRVHWAAHNKSPLTFVLLGCFSTLLSCISLLFNRKIQFLDCFCVFCSFRLGDSSPCTMTVLSCYSFFLRHFVFIKKYTDENDRKSGGVWGGGHAHMLCLTVVNFQICIFFQRDLPLLIHFSFAHCSAFFLSLENVKPKMFFLFASQAA